MPRLQPVPLSVLQLGFACGVSSAPFVLLVTKLGTEELSDFTETLWVPRGPAIHTHWAQRAGCQRQHGCCYAVLTRHGGG